MLERGSWLNEPKQWTRRGDVLSVTTDHATDFWRETHYGFTRDSGHFLGVPIEGDFTAQVRVRAAYDQLYDQAGLMVRLDERHWVPEPWRALDTELAAAPFGTGTPPKTLVVGRPGGPIFRPSELARLAHLAGIVATVLNA